MYPQVRRLSSSYSGTIRLTSGLVFCLLANRNQFRLEELHVNNQSVSHSRAILCEHIAQRILRRFNEDYHGTKGLLVLANILVSGFDTFQNAPPDIAEEHSRAFHWVDEGKVDHERKLTALEIAIITNSKNLLCSRQCQRIVEAIYQGKIIYTPTSFIDILPDHYKHKSIRLYNPRESPLLDQYRLIVPRTRYYLEIAHFIILMALYVLQMQTRRTGHFTTEEVVFCIYTFGWMLDQCATILEHGWSVYTQNLWTYLDVSFSTSFLLYFILRLVGHGHDNPPITEVAFDMLAMGAPFLVPRLAFNVLSENMLFVSLREMMSNFIVLTLLAVWSFGGFLLASSWMSRGEHSPLTIAKWMLWLWFGLDAEGIDVAPQFHWLLGPVLMISFAFLGNTLFLTILVSMLSNTFATITANSDAEIQYRRTVVAFEGVKADAIFSFPPPFNLAALFILLPLKPLLSPRWFHKVVVYTVRILNAPLLLGISFWERRHLWADTAPLWIWKFQQFLAWDISSLAVHGDLVTVFEAQPQPEELGLPPNSGTVVPGNDARGSLPRLGVPMPNGTYRDFDGKSPTATDGAVDGNSDSNAKNKKSSLADLFGPKGVGTGGFDPHSSSDVGGQARKESMGPFGDIVESLQDLLEQHIGNAGASAGSGGKEVQDKIKALETGQTRIEGMLGLICDKVGVTETEAEKVSEEGEGHLGSSEDDSDEGKGAWDWSGKSSRSGSWLGGRRGAVGRGDGSGGEGNEDNGREAA